jgi:hypothetical protein
MKTNSTLTFLILFMVLVQLSEAQNVKATGSITDQDLILTGVQNGHSIDLKIIPEKSDLSSFVGLSALVVNKGSDLFRLEGCINDNLWVNSCIYLEPGEAKRIEIIFQRRRGSGAKYFPAMNGVPGGTISFSSINPAKIEKITFKIFTKGNASLTITDIKPYGEYIAPDVIAQTPGFFPFIDKYGQYKHKNWPGKITSESDMQRAISDEDALLNIMKGPEGRNKFGGWEDGPKLKATGNFRTEKVDGRWWLVDPEGHLYWSHGITCVRFDNAGTRTSGRENFFEYLPALTDTLNSFFRKSRRDTTFNFTAANLYRKYGAQWKEKATENVLKRLKSWGINSFGNWSDQEIFLSSQNRIPYTVSVSPPWPKIDGKDTKFPDVFNPAFRESVKRALSQLDPMIKNDPYCIGFFIDNELSVNNLTRMLMKQPVNSKSRLPFMEYLKSKYKSADKLNKIWEATYSGWKQIEKLDLLPEGANEDIASFDLKILEIYYKTCREELKAIAPEKIYFGSRLHCHYFPDDQSDIQIIKTASEFCDVVCFNRYRFSAEDLILPFEIDKPTIIGEFHVGALDRGLCHSGLRNVANQDQRAEAYYRYVEGALNNPQIVGTHWFQYGDQAFTGRGDGENYQIGFVDICDNPYPEIVAAARKIGYQMYKVRSKK